MRELVIVAGGEFKFTIGIETAAMVVLRSEEADFPALLVHPHAPCHTFHFVQMQGADLDVFIAVSNHDGDGFLHQLAIGDSFGVSVSLEFHAVATISTEILSTIGCFVAFNVKFHLGPSLNAYRCVCDGS